MKTLLDYSAAKAAALQRQQTLLAVSAATVELLRNAKVVSEMVVIKEATLVTWTQPWTEDAVEACRRRAVSTIRKGYVRAG